MRSEPKAVAEVLVAMEALKDAYHRKDLQGIMDVIGDDVVFFFTGSDEAGTSSDEFRACAKRNLEASEWVRWEFRILSVAAAGNFALTAVNVKVDFRAEGEEGTLAVRWTSVFEKRDNRWLIVQFHASTPLLTQQLGESFPTRIEALASSLDASRPDLAGQAAPDGTITLLFSDIENSTPRFPSALETCVGSKSYDATTESFGQRLGCTQGMKLRRWATAS